jgi:hypothetical protein
LIFESIYKSKSFLKNSKKKTILIDDKQFEVTKIKYNHKPKRDTYIQPSNYEELIGDNDFKDSENDSSDSDSDDENDEEKMQTNKYHIKLKENKIKKEKKRLKNFMYGPSILYSKKNEDYHKFISFRKHAIFDIQTINKFEEKYEDADQYSQNISIVKLNLEMKNSRTIRYLIRYFYLDE